MLEIPGFIQCHSDGGVVAEHNETDADSSIADAKVVDEVLQEMADEAKVPVLVLLGSGGGAINHKGNVQAVGTCCKM